MISFINFSFLHWLIWSSGFWGRVYKFGSVFSQRIKTNALPDPKEQHDFLSVSLSKLLYFTQLFSRNGEVMQAETFSETSSIWVK